MKIKLDDFRKIDKKRNLRPYFWEQSDELLKRIWSVYKYCINAVYIQSKDSFFKVDVRRYQKA